MWCSVNKYNSLHSRKPLISKKSGNVHQVIRICIFLAPEMEIRILNMVEGARRATGLTVVIDVFRAFSTACYVIHKGAEQIHPVGSIESAYDLLRNNPDFQFYLVGRQDEDPVFGHEIKKFENVHHFGHTNDRYKLASFYRSGDVLLYPTINDCSPNVVLEAMSCGMPVVAANSGGTPELIYKDDIHGGILIDERNPIFALKEVVNHLDLFKERAVELVKKYHSKEIMGHNYLELFKSLM